MNLLLNPDSNIPLYLQITEHLRRQIESGFYVIGTRLPSERELAEEHGISRMTARAALRVLIHQGYAHPQVGKGTYATVPRIDQQLVELTGFSEDMKRRELRPCSKVIRAQVRAADLASENHLHLSAGSEVVELVRVRLADDVPLAVEDARLPYRIVPEILTKHDFCQESLYAVLRHGYGIRLAWASQLIQARLPDAFERDTLGLGAHDPVLSLTRVTYDERDNPVEYVTSVYSPRYQFSTILRHSDT